MIESIRSSLHDIMDVIIILEINRWIKGDGERGGSKKERARERGGANTKMNQMNKGRETHIKINIRLTRGKTRR